VQDPRGRPGATVASLDVASGAMATSGDYERFFVVEGRRYCHVMDPRSGWPVDAWQSVSVVAPLAVAAGACATIAMLHPLDEALAFLQAQGVRYLAIDAGGGATRPDAGAQPTMAFASSMAVSGALLPPCCWR